MECSLWRLYSGLKTEAGLTSDETKTVIDNGAMIKSAIMISDLEQQSRKTANHRSHLFSARESGSCPSLAIRYRPGHGLVP